MVNAVPVPRFTSEAIVKWPILMVPALLAAGAIRLKRIWEAQMNADYAMVWPYEPYMDVIDRVCVLSVKHFEPTKPKEGPDAPIMVSPPSLEVVGMLPAPPGPYMMDTYGQYRTTA